MGKRFNELKSNAIESPTCSLKHLDLIFHSIQTIVTGFRPSLEELTIKDIKNWGKYRTTNIIVVKQKTTESHDVTFTSSKFLFN